MTERRLPQPESRTRWPPGGAQRPQRVKPKCVAWTYPPRSDMTAAASLELAAPPDARSTQIIPACRQRAGGRGGPAQGAGLLGRTTQNGRCITYCAATAALPVHLAQNSRAAPRWRPTSLRANSRSVTGAMPAAAFAVPTAPRRKELVAGRATADTATRPVRTGAAQR
eukprot:351505-Chlamydomonas_euryale.AAC.11